MPSYRCLDVSGKPGPGIKASGCCSAKGVLGVHWGRGGDEGWHGFDSFLPLVPYCPTI